MLTLPGTNDQYELFGVAVHLGSGVGGHYISYVKVNKKWYLCDDTKVRLAAHRQHIDNNAYLLFYHKIDFEPSLICLSF
jgi:ubiquitin carboxyl-terminal hydrolase 8